MTKRTTFFPFVRWLLFGSFLILALVSTMESPRLKAQEDKSGSPLTINAAEGIEWNRGERRYTARGDAYAAWDGVEIFADQLVAHYRENAEREAVIHRLDAIGQVRVQSEGRQAFGQEGTYDIDQRMMTLHGDNLKIIDRADSVTARDSLVYWEGRRVAVARGDATAIHEDKRVFAQVLTAHFLESGKKGDGGLGIERVDAYGGVRLSSNSEYASSDKATYYVDREIATLEGNVKLTRGDSQLNGDRGEINLATGVSRLLSDGPTPVRGLIVPTFKDKGQTQ